MCDLEILWKNLFTCWCKTDRQNFRNKKTQRKYNISKQVVEYRLPNQLLKTSCITCLLLISRLVKSNFQKIASHMRLESSTVETCMSVLMAIQMRQKFLLRDRKTLRLLEKTVVQF